MFKKRMLVFVLFSLSFIFICMSFASANNITDDNSYNHDNNDSNVVVSPTKSFTDLNNQINDLNKSEIILENDYVNQKEDTSDYVYGVTEELHINRSVCIDGQGHTIDGNNIREIFSIWVSNVTLKNIIFKNANGVNSAISCFAPDITFINCTFINNHAGFCSGAIWGGASNIDIINSTFINNSCGNLDYGSAISFKNCGRIINSTFTDNYIYTNDEEKYAGIYYSDITFNVVNVSISYVVNDKKISSVVSFSEKYNIIIINSTFTNTPAHEIHYNKYLFYILGNDTENNATNNNSTMEPNNNTDTENMTTIIENNTASDIGTNNSNNITKSTKSAQQSLPLNSKVISLVLKSVKVKKSAKKLVLQVVLKQESKVLNDKKITFIFNGKKYVAKTNIKGIAKITIKKNILKKLKVGKKVKYQVSYGKNVSKKTLIVNK